MNVYQTDHLGFYVATIDADPDPLTPGAWLIPGGCVQDAPPILANGQRARWNGGWLVVDPEPEPQSPEPTFEERLALAEAMRSAAYRSEADPLFFKWQRAEATEQAWLNKVSEIKARYPDPEMAL